MECLKIGYESPCKDSKASSFPLELMFVRGFFGDTPVSDALIHGGIEVMDYLAVVESCSSSCKCSFSWPQIRVLYRMVYPHAR